MPAILSHHLFGRALLARHAQGAAQTRKTRDAFLLGNQGPDPLFFSVRPAGLLSTKALGRRMHREGIEEYGELWRAMCSDGAPHNREVARAYVYGFICHYTLDCMAHPMIGAFEEALVGAGVKGLTPADASFVHGQLEADLDVFLLYRRTGCLLDEYAIPKQLLYAADATLAPIDALYGAAAKLYGIKVPRKVFSQSVKDMRRAQRLLYSPGGTKRTLLGYLERTVRRHSLLQAVSHNPGARGAGWYANEDKLPWLHPQTRERSTRSFCELFELALTKAEADLALFRSGAPLSQITGGLNFYGNARA